MLNSTGAVQKVPQDEQRIRPNFKGQVTIPQELRLRAGLMPGMEIAFTYEDGKIILQKAAENPRPTRSRATQACPSAHHPVYR